MSKESKLERIGNLKNEQNDIENKISNLKKQHIRNHVTIKKLYGKSGILQHEIPNDYSVHSDSKYVYE